MCILITVLLIVWRGALWPQQVGAQTQTTDENAGQSRTGTQTTNGRSASAPQGNASSLTGVRTYNPGSLGEDQSVLLPGIQLSSYVDTNPYGASTGSGSDFLYWGSASWNLALQRIKRMSQFNLSYAGGEIVSSRPLTTYFGRHTGKYEDFHSLTLDQQINGLRWKTDFMDEFSYLPESSFGFPGFNGLNGLGLGYGQGNNITSNLLNPSLVPNQSILTGNSRRISNISAVEVDYSISPRSSISASGAYGLLHYVSSGFINTNYYVASIGYNHALTRRDNLGIYYTYNNISFSGLNEYIEGHSAQVAYGRRITGKLSLKISAGPLANIFHQPGGGLVTSISFNTYDSLQYLLRRGSLQIYYSRYTSPGSGVLFGAETDQATAALSHQLGRRFSGSIHFGYARNKALFGQRGVISGTSFKSLEGGATLSRHLGRTMSFFISYQFQREIGNAPVCLGSQCESAYMRNLASVGFSWQGRPIVLH